MRYATFSLSTDPTERIGIVSGNTLFDVHALLGPPSGAIPRTLPDLIREGRGSWARLAARIADALAGSPPAASKPNKDTIRWHSPIRQPAKNIICLGLNYSSHAHESAKARGREVKIPDFPVFFTKSTTSVNGPFDPIEWNPALTQQVDWEVELGVVIGVAGKNIARAAALDHVFGYTVINDVSARDLQARHLQWFKGKRLDTFCPMGPGGGAAHGFGDTPTEPVALRVKLGPKQPSTTANLIFPVDVIIAPLSQGLTIEPGDIIATGTPEGVGLGRTPQEFLQDGDVLETEVEGIGTLRNRIRDIR